MEIAKFILLTLDWGQVILMGSWHSSPLTTTASHGRLELEGSGIETGPLQKQSFNHYLETCFWMQKCCPNELSGFVQETCLPKGSFSVKIMEASWNKPRNISEYRAPIGSGKIWNEEHKYKPFSEVYLLNNLIVVTVLSSYEGWVVQVKGEIPAVKLMTIVPIRNSLISISIPQCIMDIKPIHLSPFRNELRAVHKTLSAKPHLHNQFFYRLNELTKDSNFS